MSKMKSIRFPPPVAAEMICAIQEGRKTVTRRVVKPQLELRHVPGEAGCYMYGEIPCGLDGLMNFSPYRPGDILYVRKKWQYAYELDRNDQAIEGTGRYLYAADENNKSYSYWVMPDGTHRDSMPWRSSTSMPREAARLFLRVTDVRVKMLKCISRGEALKEGANPACAVMDFAGMWDSTIKPADRTLYGWAANPWVWVIEFERCEKPEEV